jgi:hypothetical protein
MIQANAAMLISGPTGSGKSSLLATAAEYCYRHHKGITRLAVCDGGGMGTKTEALCELGIIQPFKMRSRVGGGAEGLVEETIMRVSQGWWPSEFLDPVQGIVREGVPLLPPMSTDFVSKCPKDHELQRVAMRGLLQPAQCPQCRILIPLAQAKITQETRVTPGFERVRAWACDGLTSASDWVMLSLADRTGRLELNPNDKAAIGRVISGDMAFAGNTRAHYGFAQTQSEKWLLHSTAIPGLALPPMWTSLETRIDAEGSLALPFYGPAIAGSAKTWKVPQWVGNYIGAAIVTDSKGKKEWRLYLSEFRGEDQIPHIYKTRAEHAGMLPGWLSDAPPHGVEGKPFSGFNLGKFFDLLQQAKEDAKRRLVDEYGEIKFADVANPVLLSTNVGGAVAAAPANVAAAAPMVGAVHAAVAGPPARPMILPPRPPSLAPRVPSVPKRP